METKVSSVKDVLREVFFCLEFELNFKLEQKNSKGKAQVQIQGMIDFSVISNWSKRYFWAFRRLFSQMKFFCLEK